MSKTIVLAIFLFGSFGTALLSPLEAAYDSFAQKLADEFTGRYMDVITVGFHLKPPSVDYQIVAHTIRSKVGKKSNEEDLEVIRTGKPDGPAKLEGGIYDLILPLYDRSGKTIGAVSIHIKLLEGVPTAEALRRAGQIRDELRKRIPSVDKMFEAAQ